MEVLEVRSLRLGADHPESIAARGALSATLLLLGEEGRANRNRASECQHRIRVFGRRASVDSLGSDGESGSLGGVTIRASVWSRKRPR